MFNRLHPASAWLGVSIVSMIFMGTYAFLVALSRAPVFNTIFPSQDFFRTALVTHVVLSVVIWFVAFMIFTIYFVTVKTSVSVMDYIPAAGGLGGVALIVATPFTGPASPMLNNYVPVLERGMYFWGLGLFFVFAALGVAVRAPALIRMIIRRSDYPVIVTGSLAGVGISLAMAIICILISWAALSAYPERYGMSMFYESLFWGGGHVLQFTNTLGLMAVWGLLAVHLSQERFLGDKAALAILGVTLIFTLIAPFSYLFMEIYSSESRKFFLEIKRWGTALGPVAVGLRAHLSALKNNTGSPAGRGLALSITLFALGGLIALTIHGSDTRVPAHYHGVIGAVTRCASWRLRL